MKIPKTFIWRSLTTLLVALVLALSTATPGLAYGKDNWQIAFSGTATFPATGTGFGFWGWCALGGGVTSGNDGDCEFSQYFHASSGSGFTCEVSLDISSWHIGGGGTFIVTGTATVHPAILTAPCVAFFPGSVNFTNADSEIPAAPGHYNLGQLVPGVPGSLQIQVVQVF